MKVLIITDLEGVSGVDNISMMDESGDGYKKACDYLANDLNSAIKAAIDANADEVFFVDGHHNGTNVDTEKVDSRAKQILSSEFAYMHLKEFDAAVCIGYHAMAGTQNAFLDHTQSALKIFHYEINGKSYGEFGQAAITCGAFSVPVVAVSGDKSACDEAKELIPDIATAVVKTAAIRNEAECVPHEKAQGIIYKAVKDGIMRAKEIKPYRIDIPLKIDMTLCRNDYCDEIMSYSKNVTRNGRIVSKIIEKLNCYIDLCF